MIRAIKTESSASQLMVQCSGKVDGERARMCEGFGILSRAFGGPKMRLKTCFVSNKNGIRAVGLAGPGKSRDSSHGFALKKVYEGYMH